MPWTKEQLRLKCRELGIPQRDPFGAPRFVVMGQELKRLMGLSWQHELYGDHAAKMSQALQQQKPRNADLCPCGKEHRHNIPRTIRSTYGFGFSVTYYCSNACKSRAAQQDSR